MEIWGVVRLPDGACLHGDDGAARLHRGASLYYCALQNLKPSFHTLNQVPRLTLASGWVSSLYTHSPPSMRI